MPAPFRAEFTSHSVTEASIRVDLSVSKGRRRPIPEAQNPHKLLASYAKDLDIVVFTGHVHTTEAFNVDGVKYLVLGGGGAEQDPILPGRTHVKVPANYPPDQYWQGADPKEEYNYLLVSVRPDERTRFTLNRYRPWATEPFESVELFK